MSDCKYGYKVFLYFFSYTDVRLRLIFFIFRDELYLHFIKQINQNPNLPDNRAISFGFELLACCLTFFPPSDKFKPYLETWIRNSKFDEWKEKYKLGFLLSRSIYNLSEKVQTFLLYLNIIFKTSYSYN